MTEIESVLDAACDALLANEPQKYLELIASLGINNLDLETVYETLVSFVLLAYSNSVPVDIIFQAFDVDNPVSETEPTLTSFYTLVHPGLTPDVLIYVAMNTASCDYGFHLYNLIHYKDEHATRQALRQLDIAYGEQDEEIYDAVLDRMDYVTSKELDYNTALGDFCRGRLADLREIAPIPDYILAYDQPIIIGEDAKATTKIPTIAELAELTGLSTDYLSTVPDVGIQGARIVQQIREIDHEADLELFRKFGPSHMLIDNLALDSASSDLCQLYGGCRMLLCTGHSDPDDVLNPTIEDDWFTGICAWPECTKPRIAARHFAVRMAFNTGGWDSECYCSWEHVLLDILPEDGLTREFNTFMAGQCHKYGIYDRVDEEEVSNLRLELPVVDAPELDWSALAAVAASWV
jgi:hypothetical protein